VLLLRGIKFMRLLLFRAQYVNPAFEKLFGYKSDEIFGKNSCDLTRSDYTKPDVINSIQSHLRAGQVISSMRYYKKITYLFTVSRVILLLSISVSMQKKRF